MIEVIVRDVLGSALTVPVVLEAPENKPPAYVVLEKTGSGRNNRIDTATIAVQSIAQTLYEAAALNGEVKTVMDELPYMAEGIFSARLNSDYNFTDEESKERRYQAVYNITYKE